MMYYSNPTASKAIGFVNREWDDMVVLAYHYRSSTRFSKDDALESRFRGIYSRLMTDPIEDLQKAYIQIMKKRKRKR